LQASGRICATTVAGLAGNWPDEDAQQRQTMQASDAYLGTSGDMSQVARPSDTLYGSEGWGFESLRARPGQRPIAIMEGAFLLNASANRSCPLLLTGCGRTSGCVRHVTYVVSPIAKFLRRCKGPPVAVCPTVPQVVGDHRAELLRGRGECDLRHMSTLGKRALQTCRLRDGRGGPGSARVRRMHDLLTPPRYLSAVVVARSVKSSRGRIGRRPREASSCRYRYPAPWQPGAVGDQRTECPAVR